MFQKKLFFYLLVLFTGCWNLWSNPIPVPLAASMPLEDMKISIVAEDNGLTAYFSGEFTFDYIPPAENSILFPVPPDARDIHVWQSGMERSWTWSDDLYPTVLPEHSEIPMIEWFGPFPEQGCVFRVDYVHSLLKRGDEDIFFYANGTGKYLDTYYNSTTAHFDITLPPGCCVNGLFRDDTPYNYQIENGHLTMTVQSLNSPIVKDVILFLSDNQSGCENIKPVFTFDAGQKYYFEMDIEHSRNGVKEVVCADLNWDNNIDLVVAVATAVTYPEQVYIFSNSGDGYFVNRMQFEIPGGVRKIYAADLDDDRDKDLVILDGEDKKFYIYLNDGYGRFSPGTTISDLGMINSLDVADFNLDGKNDLASITPESVYVFYNNGEADFAEPVIYPIQLYYNELECKDLNGDNYPDILTAPYKLFSVFNTGEGGFDEPVMFEEVSDCQPTIGDIDDDGDLDILTAHDNLVSILLNNGEGVFMPGGWGYCAVRPNPTKIFLTDLNRDNLKDLAVLGENYHSGIVNYGNTVTMLRNQGDTFKPDRDIILPDKESALLGVVDLDKDSRPDLICAGKDGDDKPYFQIRFNHSLTPGYTTGLGDVNENGKVDIVDALIVAQYYVNLNPSGFTASLEAGDVNANGKVDIIDALQIAQFYVGLLTEFPGESKFPPAPTPTPNPAPVVGGKYVLHVEAWEVIKGNPMHDAISYTGDYSGMTRTPFDIGPYSEPFTTKKATSFGLFFTRT